MATTNNGSHGGTHEQHVKAGQQSHKNTGGSAANTKRDDADTEETGSTGTRGGTHEQHVKAGQQSHKNS